LLSHEAAASSLLGPWSVMNKALMPASGSKHDYMSIGSYWWNCTAECDTTLFANCSLWHHSDLGPPGPPYANCSAQTGLPWYDHDGYHNPVSDDLDGPALSAMTDSVSALALAGYLLDQPLYSARAAMLLRAWFLDDATRMNPSGEYSQGIPGRCTGRGTGIIDFVGGLPTVLDASALLLAAGQTVRGGWTVEDNGRLLAWVAEWLRWQLASAEGREEAAQTNNHGSWCVD